VYKVVSEAVERGRNGGGSTLIELNFFRFGPHFMASFDPRPKEQQEEMRARDWPARFKKFMLDQGHMDEAEMLALEDELKTTMDAALVAVEEEHKSFSEPRESAIRNVFEKIPASLAEDFKAEEARKGFTSKISDDEIWKIDRSETVPQNVETKRMTLADALNAAMVEGMERYPELIVLGEDVAMVGGQFRVTKDLMDKYGEERVID